MSDSESEAPSAAGAGQHTSAAAALHPLWANASGRGTGGKGKGKGSKGKGVGRGVGGSTAGSDAGDAPAGMPLPNAPQSRFFPISVADLEQRHRAVADGAESSLWSADERDEQEDVAAADEAADGESGRPCFRPRPSKKRRRGAAEGDVIAGAVFGGGADSQTGSEVSDEDGESSIAVGEHPAERRLKAQKRVFHIRGVSCLGCSMERSQVDRVDQFVRENQNRLEQTALFKAASLFWKQCVVDPAHAEGVDIPVWEWKSLRSHYLLHALMPEVQRGDCIRQLAAMRKTLEMSMLREDEEGNRGLDPKGSDLMMKLIAMQSKELQLLQAASMPPPPPRGVGNSSKSNS